MAGPQGTKGDTGSAGEQGVKGETGAQGPAGAQGVAGTARAYGSVVMMTASHTPVLVTHRAKDIASVGRVATGVYWVFPAQTLDARTVSPAVSVYQPEGTATAPSYAYFGGSIVHAGKTAFVVRTYALGGEAALVPSDEVSFTVLVP